MSQSTADPATPTSLDTKALPRESASIPGLAVCVVDSHGLYKLAMAVAYLLAAGVAGLALWCGIRGEPINISREDGFVEWATVAAFGVAMLLAIAAAVMRWGQMSRSQRVLLVLFAAVCFMAVGEELSWGQRFFGFQPPESMASGQGGMVQMGHNDTTWHNLSFELGPVKFSLGGMLFSLPLFAALFVHGIWLPARAKQGKDREIKWTRKLGLFLPPVHLGILMLVLVVPLHLGKSLTDLTETREYKEMVVPGLYVFFLLHAYFRGKKRGNVAVTAGALVLLAGGLVVSALLAA